MIWFYWFSNNHSSMETMTVFFKMEDKGIKEKKPKSQQQTSCIPIPQHKLAHSSLATLHIKSVNAWACFFFPSWQIAFKKQGRCQTLTGVTFWAKAEKKADRLLSDIFTFFLREALLWPQNRLRTFLSREQQRENSDRKIKIKTTFSTQKSRNGRF